MVGEGILHECLQHTDVESVLIINRRPSGITHPKLKEIVHANFFDLSAIENELKGYNACYFCLGVSSVGMKEPEYTKMTYDLTMNVATTLSRLNPDMTFCYVSGSGTDSTEKGRSMWARVKGKTENDILTLPFRQAFMFRPGYMHATPGLKNMLPAYKYVSWLYPIFKVLTPNFVSTLACVGRAMINVTKTGYQTPIIEVKDINKIGNQ